MKKNLIIPECEWVLTEDAKTDKMLNPTDKNVLAVLQCVFDKKQPFMDGYYAIIIKKSPNAEYSLQGDLENFGFQVSEATVWRSLNKLWRFGYIDYRKGFWNKTTNSGQPPKIRILKGTTDAINSDTDSYSDIASGVEVSDKDATQLSTGITDSYSDIATTKAKTITKTQTKAIALAPYNYSNLGQVEDTTFVGEGDGVVDIKAILDSNVCNEKVMGDLLEWTINRGWFVNDVEVKRVVEQTQAECGMMKFNEDQYTDMVKAIQKKADRERLMKIIHT